MTAAPMPIDLPSLIIGVSIEVTLQSITASYYESLFSFAADALGCIKCLINPGYQIQNDALALVSAPLFSAGAIASYSVGQQLVSAGYSELGKQASQFYLNVALGSIKLGATWGVLKTENELKVFQFLLNNPTFIQYAEGLLPIQPWREVTVGGIKETWENVKDAYKLYNELNGVSGLVNAFTNSKPGTPEAGDTCNTVWGLATSFIQPPPVVRGK